MAKLNQYVMTTKIVSLQKLRQLNNWIIIYMIGLKNVRRYPWSSPIIRGAFRTNKHWVVWLGGEHVGHLVLVVLSIKNSYSFRFLVPLSHYTINQTKHLVAWCWRDQCMVKKVFESWFDSYPIIFYICFVVVFHDNIFSCGILQMKLSKNS